MNNNFFLKVKKFIAFLVIASIFIFLSYLIVYKVSILPGGYDVEAVQKDNVTLKSFDQSCVVETELFSSKSVKSAPLLDMVELFSFIKLKIIVKAVSSVK